MIDQFIDLLRAWLRLSIGTVQQLAEVSGLQATNHPQVVERLQKNEWVCRRCFADKHGCD